MLCKAYAVYGMITGMLTTFEVLAQPIRRSILDRLRGGEHVVGELAEALGLTQPSTSKHLRVLRDAGFATVRPEGTRRLYAVAPDALRDVDDWLDRFRRFWTPPLDALATELARGRRARRVPPDTSTGEPRRDT
jgi:DNA-binding transcriptional ArsR family regulator